MKKLDQHIYQLLFRHDCVVVPNFGGFVGNEVPAKFDPSGTRLVPPSKSILFNKYLINNDGLLGHEIAIREGISYEDAMEQIVSYVAFVRKELETKRKLEVEGVGQLYLDRSNNLCFKDGQTNFLISTFGLPPTVSLPKVQLAVEEEQEEQIEVIKEPKVVKLEPVVAVKAEVTKESEEDEKVIPIERGRSGKVVRNSLIVAALIPLAFYSVWIPTQTQAIAKGSITLSDFNPFHKSERRVYSQNSINITNDNAEVIIVEENGFTSIELGDRTVVLHEKMEEVQPKADSTRVEHRDVYSAYLVTEKTYFVIGGCFKKRKHVDRFIKKMRKKGYDAMYVDHNDGLHRVAYGALPSRKEANALKAKVRDEEGESSWVLKKR